jgi:threonine synthase
MSEVPLDLFCPACRRSRALGRGLFACPAAREGEEHFLRRRLKDVAGLAGRIETRWLAGERCSFLLFRDLISARQIMGDDAYRQRLERIEDRLARQQSRGFFVTPCAPVPGLETALGWKGSLRVKDDTGNVTGSHKGRHLMGTLLYLEALRHGRRAPKRVLAVYSCGNAALAAAAVARAGAYELHAFVPATVEPSTERLLHRNGALVEKHARTAGTAGDPCYHAFRCAVEQKSWIPFSCSGSDNWSAIEGGTTLGWETALQLKAQRVPPTSLVVQVGGGALGRSVAQAFAECRQTGVIDWTPQLYLCQPEGGFPLARAYYLLLKALSGPLDLPFDWSYDRDRKPASALAALRRFAAGRASRVRRLRRRVQERFDGDAVQTRLAEVLGQRGRFMWAWDGGAPQSLAHGILDDETYDWYDLLMAVLRSGGKVEILAERRIREAHRLALRYTAMRPCPTGSAGLAALLQLAEEGEIGIAENAVLFFTGIDRR